jgi:hypothetical protein
MNYSLPLLQFSHYFCTFSSLFSSIFEQFVPLISGTTMIPCKKEEIIPTELIISIPLHPLQTPGLD